MKTVEFGQRIESRNIRLAEIWIVAFFDSLIGKLIYYVCFCDRYALVGVREIGMEVLSASQDVPFLDTSEEDMTAVSLPVVRPTNLDANTKISNDIMCIFGSEDQLQSLSKENMDQIRNTMIQHEQLFKEQVHALHKLYNAQKSAMHEISKMINCSSKYLASKVDTGKILDGQVHSSIMEGKPLKTSYFTAQDFYVDQSNKYGNLPVHPIYSLKEFTSPPKSISCMNKPEIQGVPSDQNKMRRMIDLERPPEEYMDESDCQMEANNFAAAAADAESSALEGKVSCMECNHYGLPMDSPSFNWKDSRPEFRTLSVANQETHRACDRDLQSKIDADYIKKCTRGIWNLQKAFEHNILQDFPWNHLPAVGNCPTHAEANASTDQHEKKSSWLLQGSLPFSAQRLNQAHDSDNLEGNRQQHFKRPELEQVIGSLSPKNAYFLSATELCLTGEQQSRIAVPELKNDQQVQCDSSACFASHGVPLPEDPIIDPQASSTNKSPESGIKDPHELCVKCLPFPEKNSLSGKDSSCSLASSFQTGKNDATEIPNCSGEGSNSPTSQSPKVCRDGCLDYVATGSTKCSTDSEAVITDLEKVGREPEEPNEMPELAIIDDKPSSLFSIPDSEVNNVQRDCCSNVEQKHATEVETGRSCHFTEINQEEQAVAETKKEEWEMDSAAEEACESIAAKILLSFAPCRSLSDAKILSPKTRMEADSSQSSRASSGLGNKCRARRCVNYNDEAGVDEAANCTKSVQGRRRRNPRRQR